MDFNFLLIQLAEEIVDHVLSFVIRGNKECIGRLALSSVECVFSLGPEILQKESSVLRCQEQRTDEACLLVIDVVPEGISSC